MRKLLVVLLWVALLPLPTSYGLGNLLGTVAPDLKSLRTLVDQCHAQLLNQPAVAYQRLIALSRPNIAAPTPVILALMQKNGFYNLLRRYTEMGEAFDSPTPDPQADATLRQGFLLNDTDLIEMGQTWGRTVDNAHDLSDEQFFDTFGTRGLYFLVGTVKYFPRLDPTVKEKLAIKHSALAFKVMKETALALFGNPKFTAGPHLKAMAGMFFRTWHISPRTSQT